MIKKITTFAIGLLLTAGLWAQSGNNEMYGHAAKGDAKSISFSASDIEFWTGTGSNQAVVIVGWDDNTGGTNFALAWGVRWSGTATAQNMLDTIMAYDSRFTYSISGSFVTDVSYNDGTLVSGSDHEYWCYNVNNSMASAYPFQMMTNGDVMEISSSCDFLLTTATAASNPNNTDPVDATIDTSDIVYWVGTGSNSLTFVVNWADTVLAWGYRFSTESVSMQTVINDLGAADPRLTFGATGMLDDIWFVENSDTLKITPGNYWEHSVNGYMSAGMGTTFHNGDFSRWADPAGGVVVDSTYYDGWGWFYTYAYPRTIYPVSEPYDTPTDATISADDITYWVGEGPFDIIFVVNWPDTALAWGYHFSARSTNLQNVMHAIAAEDSRLVFVEGSYGIDDILFIENGDTLRKAESSWWEHILNGNMSSGLSQQLNDGDFSRWADPTVGVVVDSTYDTNWNYWMYTRVYPQTITPVSEPTPVDARISASEIEYWVGEGENELVFTVNWADTALAWGYRFAADSVMLGTVMDDIVAADSRFSYVNEGYVRDILFVEDGDTLGVTPGSWWEHMVNGIISAGMGQWMHNGDFSRWADPVAGVAVDSVYYEGWGWSYFYVYPQRIYPVSSPEQEVGPFCGAVGTEGCTAVKYDDGTIKAWATGCTLVRGSQNLSNPDAPAVDYGTEEDAIGPASSSTMDVVSLGDGGMATVTFATPIANGDGYDFAVYENSFNDYFLELAVVEVSSDGEHFVRFPATSLTQTHTQITEHVDPTFINNLAGKYRVGYGTPFDLDELRDSAGIDINSITHVRVIDVVGSIDPQYGTYDAFGHLINDPFPTITYSAGFDLDGVAVLNEKTGIGEAATTAVRMYPNPANGNVCLTFEAQNVRSEVAVYDMAGRKVTAVTVEAGANRVSLNTAAWADGVYMVRMGSNVEKLVVRH